MRYDFRGSSNLAVVTGQVSSSSSEEDRLFASANQPFIRSFWSNVMNKNYVRISLSENATGWAKPITEKLVQIASVPYSAPVGFEDIVELDRQPGRGLSKIHKVLVKSGLGTTILQYEQPAQVYQLMNLLAMLGAVCEGMFQPEGDKPGLLAVAHPEGIDPVGLAIAVGIPQPLAGSSLVQKLKARWPGDNADRMIEHGPAEGEPVTKPGRKSRRRRTQK